MAQIKIVLRQKLAKDGTLPLCSRITKDRKTSYVYLGNNIHETDRDKNTQRVKTTHPNSTRLNNFLLKN